MSIRGDILAAYKTALESITIANGYNTDVETVEYGVRNFNEVKTRPGLRCWIGIGPTRENLTDRACNQIDSRWEIQLLVHQSAGSRALSDVVDANSKIVADIRKALYSEPALGVDGVIQVSITGVETNDASPEAGQHKAATCAVITSVLFVEEVSDS